MHRTAYFHTGLDWQGISKCALILWRHCLNNTSNNKFTRKFVASIMLIACLQFNAAGNAQVTYSGKAVALEKVFDAIRMQTDYLFFYNTQLLSKANPVTIDVRNAPVEVVLNLCLENQPLSYSISNKTIFIKLKAVPPSNAATIVQNNLAQINKLINAEGIVVDPDGAPIQSVNVSVRGTNKGTSTNVKGEFFLPGVSESAVLIITCIGYNKQELRIGENSNMRIQLDVASGTLDEAQVVAYGSTSRRVNLGNVSSIKASDIERQPIQNPLLAIAGRAPGLLITQQSGIVGGGVVVRVGTLQNSIGKGNEPLVVIDGVPYPTEMPRTENENTLSPSGSGQKPSPLNFINPSDIESIDILKDADATSIYGSRAANGAILITTKKGKKGQNSVAIGMQYGMSKIARKVEMMNTRQYLDMRYEAYRNDGIDWTRPSFRANDLKLWDTTRYTDWQKELIGETATYLNSNASLTGGNDILQYLVGVNYNKSTTVFPGNFGDQRGSIHINLTGSSINKKLTFQLGGNYMINNNKLPGYDLTANAIRLAPIAPPIYNESGQLNWAPNASGTSTWSNPLSPILHNKYENSTTNLVSNFTISYNIIKGLNLKSSFGYNRLETDDLVLNPLETFAPEIRSALKRTTYFGRRQMTSWIVEPQLTYNKVLGNHEAQLLVGSSLQQSASTASNLKAEGFGTNDVMRNPLAATNLSVQSYLYTQYKYAGIFTRLNYSLNNRYLLNISMRRDGSSRFGSNNKFKTFGSVAGGWIFSEELFAKSLLPILSFGKIRASFGTTGNDQIGDYKFLSLYSNISSEIAYQGTQGLSIGRLTNQYLEWEETKKLQVGLDLGLFRDKLILNFTYSRNRSSNQLLLYQLPSTTGFTSIEANFPATVENSSIEISVNSRNIKKKYFEWNSNVNITIPKNKLVSYPDLESSSFAGVLKVGKPINIVNVYKFAGVDPQTGIYSFYDNKGDITTTPNYNTDRVIIVNMFPRYYGGVQNTFTFKGLQLDFLFTFVKQFGANPIFNNGSNTRPGAFSSMSSNMPVTLLDRWQKQGDITSIQRFSTVITPENVLYSDAYFTDASFIRLRNVSISWKLPGRSDKERWLPQLTCFLQGQNIATWTKYNGADPESMNLSSLPLLRTITGGFRLTM